MNRFQVTNLVKIKLSFIGIRPFLSFYYNIVDHLTGKNYQQGYLRATRPAIGSFVECPIECFD